MLGLEVETCAGAYELGSIDGWLPYELVARAVRAGFVATEDGTVDGTELGMEGVVGWLVDAGGIFEPDWLPACCLNIGS